MATLAAIEFRRAELLKRLKRATESLARKTAVEYPPAFPYARQPAYRANDELEQMVLFVEGLDALDLVVRGNEDG